MPSIWDEYTSLAAGSVTTATKKKKIVGLATKARVPRVIGDRPVVLIRYKRLSRSARQLSRLLNTVEAITDATKEHIIINWGSAHNDYFYGADTKPGSIVLNKPTAVSLCRNKLKFFKAAKDAKDGPRIPTFTTELDQALEWVNKGDLVFGRQTTGSCGLDIVTYEEDPAAFQQSEFWVVYKKKKNEFRIHVAKGAEGQYIVLDQQQKVLRKTDPVTNEPILRENVNFLIRNHRNGFIFQRNEIKVPDDVITQAIKAAVLSGIDFGAIDIIWNEHEAKSYVLEINTAPGLEGTTLDNYYRYFNNYLNALEPKPNTL